MQIINRYSTFQNKKPSFSAINTLAEEILLERHGKNFIGKVADLKKQLQQIENSQTLHVEIRPHLEDKTKVMVQAFHDIIPPPKNPLASKQKGSTAIPVRASAKLCDFRKVIQYVADQAKSRVDAVLK